MSDAPDPVRRRRGRIARIAAAGRKLGYGLFALALALFAVAVARGFEGYLATLVIAALIAGSVVLAPAIVLGYAVRAAEREDRERGL